MDRTSLYRAQEIFRRVAGDVGIAPVESDKFFDLVFEELHKCGFDLVEAARVVPTGGGHKRIPYPEAEVPPEANHLRAVPDPDEPEAPRRQKFRKLPRKPNTPARVLAAVALNHGKAVGARDLVRWVVDEVQNNPLVQRDEKVSMLRKKSSELSDQIEAGEEAIERMVEVVDKRCNFDTSFTARFGRAVAAYLGDGT